MNELKTQSSIDVSSQNHYTKHKIQHIEVATVNNFNWCESCILKYIWRWKDKNGVEDLRKAAEYLKVLINFAESGHFKTPDVLKQEGYKI